MFDYGAALARDIFGGILPLYRDVNFSYAIAAVMALAAVLLIIIALLNHVRQARMLNERTQIITSFVSGFGSEPTANSTADPDEVMFASRFNEIDQKLGSGVGSSRAVALAWQRYRKTLSFLGAPPIRSTQQPSDFFYAATPSPTWLGFAANLFVAFGLLATFLGLVAALTFASAGMNAQDSGAMQTALRDLLTAAASKFVTSVSGVGLSIVLRLVERLLVADLHKRVDRLSSALEFGIRVDKESHSAAVAEQISRLLSQLDRDSRPQLGASIHRLAPTDKT